MIEVDYESLYILNDCKSTINQKKLILLITEEYFKLNNLIN